jgi:outer membrane protein assembly factor BamB
MRRPSVLLAAAATCLGLALGHGHAADWPTYRGDALRSGYTGDALPAALSLRWTYRARHAPRPAWSGRDTRMPFDRALQPVVAGGTLFFASSADDKVYALDAATGAERWSFFTDGPVRLAPAVSGDRVFVAGDDGFLCCLAASDGRLLWKLRGGPDQSRVLGNDRIVSRWPARGGPVIVDGVVYFAAGIWPSEGIFVYAVDAATGKVLWCNDSSGGIVMPQPHPGAVAKSGVSAQGHLLAAGDLLLVPTGRAVPAAFRRADGKLVYFHLQQNRAMGGSEILVAGDRVLNGGAAFELESGTQTKAVPPLRPSVTAATPEGLLSWQKGEVRAFRWKDVTVTDRKGTATETKGLEQVWSVAVPYGGTSLVAAGATAVSAGEGPEGYGVSTVDVASRRSVWSERVDGLPWGLCAAGGRLYVSTDHGTIYCFDQTAPENPAVIESAAGGANPTSGDLAASAGADAEDEATATAAEEILRQSGVTEGYCLDLACGDGSLAYALAKRTGLQVYAVDADPQNVAAARARLDAAGLYGVRVTVHQGDPAKTACPDYFANLVVSGRSVREGKMPALEDEVSRVLRPYGGVAVIGKPGDMGKIVRGPLADAGSWTHQYCDPANTNCSTDARVRAPLGVLWFTDFGFPVPSRHGRGRAPLFLDGRLFVEGTDGLLAVDAYNGRKLWQYPLPGIQAGYDGEHLMGTSGTGSNLCVADHGLYVHTGDKCLRIEPAAGKLLGELPAPPQPDGTPGTWGIVACVGKTLVGTLANTEHRVTYRFRPGDMSTQFTESLLLFPMDPATSEVKWRYQPEHSIRNNAIAVGGGRVHLVDRPMALGDRHLEKRRGVPDPGDVHPAGTLVTLDLADGRVLWKSDDEIYGTVLALSEEHQTLLMCYQDWRFKLASELGGRMAAFDAATGQRRWDVECDGVTRPIINGQTVYMQPGAWDLLTGERKDFQLSRSYGCGIPSGAKHLMVFRSATVGYCDLTGNRGTENYGGIRPGCWINAIPAGGLVLMPDATDRCTCSYLIKASIALEPRGEGPVP